jgi:hypothetical protein
MILTAGKYFPHTIVKNSLEDFPVRFYDNNYVAAAPGVATIMSIEGFGQFKLPTLRTAKGNRAVVAQTQRLNISSANPLEITYTAPASPNTEVSVIVEIKSSKYLAEFHNAKVDRGTRRVYQLILQPTDTTATVLAKLYNAIKFEDPIRGNIYFDLDTVGFASVGTFDPITGRATSVTELNIQSKYDYVTLVVERVEDATSNVPSAYLALTPTVVRPAIEGVNDYNWMTENARIITENSVYPYAIYENQMPVKGNLYADFTFDVRKDLVDVYNHAAADADGTQTVRHNLFVNQTACEAVVDDIATFLNQVVTPAPMQFSAYVGGVYTSATATLAQFQANV